MGFPTISDSAVVVMTRDLLVSEFGDEVVILNLRDGVYHGLEETGARIWRLLREPVTFRNIRDVVVSEYDVAPEQCERDVRALIGELAASGLVEIRESSG
jgi:hypothetical protein